MGSFGGLRKLRECEAWRSRSKRERVLLGGDKLFGNINIEYRQIEATSATTHDFLASVLRGTYCLLMLGEVFDHCMI